MRIVCADRSRLGLAKLKRVTGQLAQDARIEGFRKPSEVLRLAEEQKIDILLTELDFGGSRWEGLELERRVKELQPSMNIIFVTAEPGGDFSEDAMKRRRIATRCMATIYRLVGKSSISRICPATKSRWYSRRRWH